MNSLVEHQLPILEQTLALRPQLLDLLSDADLTLNLPGNPRLGELCLQSGLLDETYLESFRTFAVDWTPRKAPEGAAGSVATLREWFARSDASWKPVLEALSEEDVQRRPIDRQGYTVGVGIQLHIYRESILIFSAKASLYLRALDKPLPEQWQQWIG